jgi:hypothetical protein
MKNIIHTLLFVLFIFSIQESKAFVQNKEKLVVGFVTSFSKPLGNVSVSIKDNKETVFTDSLGKYSIEVGTKQVLVFSLQGMETVEIKIEDVTSVLNISLLPKVEKLNEVVVSKKRVSNLKKLEERYVFDKNIVNTAFGYINARSSGHRVMTFDETDFEGTGAIDIFDFIEKYTSARLSQDSMGTNIVTLRYLPTLTRTPASAGFDIDGAITRDFPIHIPITDIKRLAIIYGPAISLRYGNVGLGGMVIINTRSANYKFDPDNLDKPYDYAKLRGNKYANDAIAMPVDNYSKVYLSSLLKAKTQQEAFETFEAEKESFDHLPFYLFDVASYFKTVWNATEIQSGIYTKIEEDFFYNANVLKALAYQHEIEGNKNKARELYVQIIRLRPEYSQSYRDLANSYSDNSSFNKAFSIYSRYETHVRSDSTHSHTEIDSIIRTESKNLAILHGDEITKGISDEVYKDVWPVRVLLEWSHSDADFEVQLVHPTNSQYVWKNTMEENYEIKKIQKQIGYSSKQFYIDDFTKGNWKVNIKYLGNKSFEPTYVKATVFYNYNNPIRQNKKIQLFKLSEINQNFRMLEISSSLSLTMAK